MAVLAGGRDNVVSISAAESLKMFSLSVVWGSWVVVKNAVALAVRPLWSTGGGGGGHGNRKRAAANDGVVRDRPPPCLFNAVYGTHSYVKVKVTYNKMQYCNIIQYTAIYHMHSLCSSVELGGGLG
jgi:epoxide hydrolase 4